MSRHKSKCAVCGRNIEEVVRHSLGDEEYHFCCEGCRLEFIKDPHKYEDVWINFGKEGIDTGAIICAVCGTQVSEEVATRQEHQEEVSREKYFFCTEKHRIEFINDPESFKGFSGKHMSQ